MKKLIFLFLAPALLLACNSPAPSSASSADSKKDTTSEVLNYPYTISHPGDYWEPGDQKNALMVLNSLKAFENGNTDEAANAFGDSVSWRFDYFDKKVSKDTLKAMFKNFRAGFKKIEIRMHDWESVISKDKKEQYVSLWYTQVMEDNKGKIDSVYTMNDLKIENGKISELDEKFRQFPKKK
jgi:hypothetical protein